MRYTFFCLFWLLFAVGACVSAPPARVWTEPAVRALETAGTEDSRLFELTRTWFVRFLNSPKPIIEVEDPGSGTIVANCQSEYPAVEGEEIARIQYSVSFRIIAKISGGRITLRYDSPAINVPKYYSRRAERLLGREYFGGYSRPPVSTSEIVAVEQRFEEAVVGLRRHLEAESGR